MREYEAFLQAKRTLEEEKKRWELFLASSEVGLWDWDIQSGVVCWDAQCYTMLGYTPDAFAVTYEVWLNLIHPDDQQSAALEVQRQLAKGDTFSIQFRFQSASGGWFWVEGRGKVVDKDDHGNPLRMVGMHVDRNASKEAEYALLERDRLLEKLSEQLPGVMYQFQYFPDGRSRMPFASQQMKTLYDVFPEELKEDTAAAFRRVHPEDLERVLKSIEVSSLQLSQWTCEYRVVLPRIGVRWHRGVANPEKYHDGSVLWHGYISDITEARNTQDSLFKAKEDAEKATRAKSLFLANMSHEVRTPLNAIIGIGALLEQTASTEKERGLIEKMNHSSKLLLTMLNDVLDYAKLEADKIALERTPFCLRDVLVSVKEMFEAQAMAKGIGFECEMKEGIPLKVVGDRLRLLQIVSNLVSNAIKFSAAGLVRLELDLLGGTGNTRTYGIRVRDTGIGMPLWLKESMFEPFAQGDSSIARKYGGTGLGLSIVQKLLHLMQGSLHVTSQEGVGSVFEISLPLELQKNVPVGAQEEAWLASLGAFAKRMDNADFIPLEEVDVLVDFLRDKIDQGELQEWKEAMARLDYALGLDVIKKWQKENYF